MEIQHNLGSDELSWWTSVRSSELFWYDELSPWFFFLSIWSEFFLENTYRLVLKKEGIAVKNKEEETTLSMQCKLSLYRRMQKL